MPELTVRVVDLADSRELRRSVLRPEFAPGSMLPGEDQAGTICVAALAGSNLVSACLIFPESCRWQPDRPAWRLRSMATHPDFRGTGAGAAALGGATGQARARGAELLWCEARQPAVGFYLRHGWQLWGEPFENSHGPHRFMWVEL
ncbi:MAG TPA: GNAT family N-acetyltransferase [Jatrophihabitans sp.]|nr:GNAT family N-acetyltransferase [Jatrophihabitans sp.]